MENIIKTARLKNKPANVSAATWANAMNWNIEAWKCHVAGQKWSHSFEICCPEQYFMLLDKKGNFILKNVTDIRFADSIANRSWIKRLEQLVSDMRSKKEWNESMQWASLILKIKENQQITPNEDAFRKSKTVVKGYRLIRIKSAA